MTDELAMVVKHFLDLALVHPIPAPKTQSGMRENHAMIIGFCRAQEDLRALLAKAGFKELAKIRNDKQLRPMQIGEHRVWR